MTKRVVFQGMPKGLRGPHVDSPGPCNDPGCRKCDPVRDQLRKFGMRVLKHQERRRMLR